jgi:hypothetical protein
MHDRLRWFLTALCVLALAGDPEAFATPPVAAPATTRFTLEESAHGVVVSLDGRPFASYVIDEVNKPYLWPVIGPTGQEMTRAFPMETRSDEPAVQRDHPHHRGIFFGHEDAGSDTWHDRSTFAGQLEAEKTAAKARDSLARLGRIRHREFSRLSADDARAVVDSVCDHLDPDGEPLFSERRRFVFRATDDARTIDFDQDLVGGSHPVRLGDRKDAGLSIRMPVEIAVDSKQGGRIVNSDGLVDVAAWGRPARWCDYHGPIEGGILGVAILEHPSSFRHPTRWHVRTYGLFTANPFAQKSIDPSQPEITTTLAPGESIRLRHRFIFHTGDEKAAGIDAAWQAYAEEPQGE